MVHHKGDSKMGHRKGPEQILTPGGFELATFQRRGERSTTEPPSTGAGKSVEWKANVPKDLKLQVHWYVTY